MNNLIDLGILTAVVLVALLAIGIIFLSAVQAFDQRNCLCAHRPGRAESHHGWRRHRAARIP
jgi:hypothetical protein